jgi:putrescine transport system permease protein
MADMSAAAAPAVSLVGQFLIRHGRLIVVGLPALWLSVFVAIPFLIVLRISLSTAFTGSPPFQPVLDYIQGWAGLTEFLGQLSAENYRFLLTDSLYLDAYLSSLWIAAASTIMVIVIGYPLAYGIARAPGSWRPTLLLFAILPFWTSFVIRVYSWIAILRDEGLLNNLLMATGIISEPLVIYGTNTAVYIGIVYSYLPFFVLPLYATLEKMDESLVEAARDLGASRLKAFWLVTFPISSPGVVAGAFLVFVPAIGEVVVPELLGGSNTLMIGKILWNEFFANQDWPVASAVAVVLFVTLIVPIVIFQRLQARV